MMTTHGDKTARLIDVAREVGVHKTTVSRVLLGTNSANIRVGEETAARIREAAERLNFRPNMAARQLAGVRCKVLGVLMRSDATMVHYFRLREMERAAQQAGYRLMVGHLSDSMDFLHYVHDFQARQVDGLISVVEDTVPAPYLEILARGHHVVFEEKPPVDGASYVALDHAPAAREAVRRMVARGHRRIALAFMDMRWECNVSRLRGYRAGLKEHGIPYDERLVWVSSGADGFHLQPQRAAIIVDNLVKGANADAILAANDNWAAQFIRVLHKRGLRVPEDVAIVGQDNFELATSISPELTTIDQRDALMARTLVRLLLSQIEQEEQQDMPKVVRLEPQLVVRDSA